MKRVLLTIPTLALGWLVLTGCNATKVNTVERAQPEAQRQMLADKRVLQDINLNKYVRILGVNQSTGVGGHLKIQIEVMNLTSTVRHFTYRVEWFDETGMLITSPPPQATPRQIEGKETIFLSASAPTPTAKDFRVKFMEIVR